ncbi:hypothetical protein WDW89_25055 [Deltaproteobacteria bacterium TL4]
MCQSLLWLLGVPQRLECQSLLWRINRGVKVKASFDTPGGWRFGLRQVKALQGFGVLDYGKSKQALTLQGFGVLDYGKSKQALTLQGFGVLDYGKSKHSRGLAFWITIE